MNVESPNNAGGIGDRSGIVMFDLIVGRAKYESRSNERLLREYNGASYAADQLADCRG